MPNEKDNKSEQHLWGYWGPEVIVDDSGATAHLPKGYGNPSECKTPPINQEFCSHDWAVYNSGFSEFEYCRYCNKKKD